LQLVQSGEDKLWPKLTVFAVRKFSF